MITKGLKVLDDFCKGCGTCKGVCSNGAIRLEYQEKNGRYLPRIDQKICRKCGICFQSCPAWPFAAEGTPFQSANSAPIQNLVGSFLDIYSGFAIEEDIRLSSSSGGIASALLIHQLVSHKIDAALITRLNEGNPLGEPIVLLAENLEEIKKATGSKYLPVPLNKSIREIINRKDLNRIGVVGLPCHIEGLKKAGAIFHELENKIAFTVGLFCRQTKELGFTRLMLSRLGADASQLHSFSYRGSGWPGYVRAELRDGEERKCLFFDDGFLFLWLLQSFTPMPCMLCCDPMSEFADISIGDAWLEEFAEDKCGTSLVIVRTSKGETLIKEATLNNILSLQVLKPERLLKSQGKRAIMRKKINYRSKLVALKPSGYKEIKKNFNQKSDFKGILALRRMKMMRNISSSKLFTSFFSIIPSVFFATLKKGLRRKRGSAPLPLR